MHGLAESSLSTTSSESSLLMSGQLSEASTDAHTYIGETRESPTQTVNRLPLSSVSVCDGKPEKRTHALTSHTVS